MVWGGIKIFRVWAVLLLPAAKVSPVLDTRTVQGLPSHAVYRGTQNSWLMPLNNLLSLDQTCFTDSQKLLRVLEMLRSQIGLYLCTLLCTIVLGLLEPACMATDAFPFSPSQGPSCLPLCVCSRNAALALLLETSQWPREVESQHLFHTGVNTKISLTSVLLGAAGFLGGCCWSYCPAVMLSTASDTWPLGCLTSPCLGWHHVAAAWGVISITYLKHLTC